MFNNRFVPKKTKPRQVAMAFAPSGYYDKDGKPVITGISLVPAGPNTNPPVTVFEVKDANK